MKNLHDLVVYNPKLNELGYLEYSASWSESFGRTLFQMSGEKMHNVSLYSDMTSLINDGWIVIGELN